MHISLDEINSIISKPETKAVLDEINTKYEINITSSDLLAWGGQGLIFKSKNNENTQNIIIKIPIYSSTKDKTIIEHTMLKEAQVYEFATMNNISCVPTLLSFSADGKYLIHSYVEGENLRDYIKKHDMHNRKEVAQQEWKIATELFHFCHNHTPAYIIRDFKEKNIIITNDNRLFFIDFGSVRQEFSSSLSGTKKNKIGTNSFLHWPLEQLIDTKSGNSKKSDYFSFGVMLYYTLYKEYPYTNKEKDFTLANKIRNHEYMLLLQKLKKSYNNNEIQYIIYKILVCTLNPDFEKRSFFEYKADYFSKINGN